MLTVRTIYIKTVVVCKTIVDYNIFMRTCSICEIEKAEQDFFYRDKKAGKLHSQCKTCYSNQRQKTWKEYYYRHGSNYRERAVDRNRRLKASLREQLYSYLADKQCVSCGIKDPRVLEFDHIDPKTKSFAIARAVHDILSWDKILAEVSKCQVLCANCHKIKTAEQQGWYKHKATLLSGLNVQLP